MKAKIFAISIITLMIVSNAIVLFTINAKASDSPSWPTSWTLVDEDPNEGGTNDDHKDGHYIYYSQDSNYIYLRLECWGYPAFPDDKIR